MPSREQEPQREQGPDSAYFRAARYGTDDRAYQAYSQAQGVLFSEECDLSAYRIRFKDVAHVVIVGQKPPDTIERKLVGILENGEPASLPPDIIATLNQRRQAARRIGGWVEGHYRPGRQV
jgi:hypothetical protein